MARKLLVNLDLNNNQVLNALLQLLGVDPALIEGKVFYHSGTKTLRFGTDTAYVVLGRLDQISAPTADVSLNSHKLTNVADPTSTQDAATKAYVDAVRQGLDVKASARLGTAAALPANTRSGNILTASGVGALTIDGTAAAAGNRVLIKDEVTAANNGIYDVTDAGSGATPWVLTRSDDFDDNASVTPGAFVFVEAGTANSDSGFVLTTNAPIVLNTTSLTFVQFSGAGQITAGAGLSKTGNTIDVNVDGTSVEIVGDTLGVVAAGLPVLKGGTGATTTGGAKTSLGFLTRYAASIGDGSSLTYNVDHNLNTTDVTVSVFGVSDGVEVMPDVTRTSVNRVVVGFAVAPTAGQYRVVVVG